MLVLTGAEFFQVNPSRFSRPAQVRGLAYLTVCASLQREATRSTDGVIMTQQQWETIERTLQSMSVEDKRDVARRILESIKVGDFVAERTERQREALDRLCARVDAMPAVTHDDRLSNRDHDRILCAQ
jgi:hypothetical protein